MNAATVPARQLICLLQDTAGGSPADLAAVELIARHDHFLRLPGFRRIIATGSSVFTGEPLATIRWQAAITALESGRLPSTRTERAVLLIAASLGDHHIPVHLRDVLGSLDHRNITLIADAITAANG